MRKLTVLIVFTLLPHVAVSQHVDPEDKAEASKMYRYAYDIDRGAHNDIGASTYNFDYINTWYFASSIDSVATYEVYEAVYGPSLPYDASPVRLFFNEDDKIEKVIRIGSANRGDVTTLHFEEVLDTIDIQKVTSIASDPTYSYQIYVCNGKKDDSDVVVCRYDDNVASMTQLYDNHTMVKVYHAPEY